MIKGIRHYGIVVEDLKKSLKFYRDFLGLKEIGRSRMGGRIWIKLKSPDGKLLELYEDTVITELNPHIGDHHIAFTVDNIEKFYKDILPYVYIEEKIITQEKHKLFFCRDYCGNLLEFVEERK